MTEHHHKKPACFGNLDKVFPMGKDGLRHTPDACLKCLSKTPCLKNALNGPGGIEVHEEVLDRSYHSGITGFWTRWSRKKALYKKRKRIKNSK